MPTDKDLKRLVRARMKKTGESYTTARAQITRTRTKAAATPRAAYAERAGMSDAAVRRATGRDWSGWVDALDAAGAADLVHKDIASHLRAAFDVSDWWAQTVTVGYERIRGLRDVGQRRGGLYDANKSRTFAVPVTRLYRAVRLARTRRLWLPGVDLTIRTATPDKSIRATWPDDTHVDFHFTAKGPEKSQVAIQHKKLPSRSAIDERKAYWHERLDELKRLLARS